MKQLFKHIPDHTKSISFVLSISENSNVYSIPMKAKMVDCQFIGWRPGSIKLMIKQTLLKSFQKDYVVNTLNLRNSINIGGAFSKIIKVSSHCYKLLT